jgi:hypothetical protein
VKELDHHRLQVLLRFIRNQANLTDEKTPRRGPGEVKLNHEAATLLADALEDYLANRHKIVMLDELLPTLNELGIIT